VPSGYGTLFAVSLPVSEFDSPYLSCQQWVNGIEPIIELLVGNGLYEQASVSRQNGKRVMRLHKQIRHDSMVERKH